MNTSPYKKKLHFLYHIEDVGFKMLTESEAEDYKTANGDVIWNVHKSIDIEPEYLETK
jgi:hypothetical protein